MQVVPMKGKVAKVAKAVVSSHHNLHCKISKGNLIVAKTYFYTNGYTSLDLKNAVIELFNKHNKELDVSKFDTSHVKSTDKLFPKHINNNPDLDVSKFDISHIKHNPKHNNHDLDVSKFDTSHVKHFKKAFE